jgi:excinuclease ABC subunit C
MREVLGRRFLRTDEDLPDLVVVDGGKGQLQQAILILEELNLFGKVPVCGLAKARTEGGFQDQEVEASQERIFLPNRMNPIPLPNHSKAFKILTHLRDEAHRFAITYHRNLRRKRTLEGG